MQSTSMPKPVIEDDAYFLQQLLHFILGYYT